MFDNPPHFADSTLLLALHMQDGDLRSNLLMGARINLQCPQLTWEFEGGSPLSSGNSGVGLVPEARSLHCLPSHAFFERRFQAIRTPNGTCQESPGGKNLPWTGEKFKDSCPRRTGHTQSQKHREKGGVPRFLWTYQSGQNLS